MKCFYLLLFIQVELSCSYLSSIGLPRLGFSFSPTDNSKHKRREGRYAFFRLSSSEEYSTPHFNHKVSLPESYYTQVLTTNSISSIAVQLRQSYDDRFRDPREPNSDRFLWDPWFVRVGDGVKSQKEETNVESLEESSLVIDGEEEAANKQVQYSLKRIQSSTFFTEDEFGDLVDEMTQLGRSIGLTAITPPWMSLYTNGDQQNFHTDAPQGQMAFVLSLSKEGDFDGGETMLLKPEILDYWKGFEGSRGLESGGIFRYVLLSSYCTITMILSLISSFVPI